ncbi:MAG TPA: ABC transporter permease [Bacteroidetes bacterium]|nr:ABC transporter permease [Bacteroidota bacterium]
MITFLLKRIVYSLLILWGVATLIFLLFNVLPGDPARMLLGQRADEKSLEAIRRDLGLDRPVGMQYLKYLNDLSPLSLHNINVPEHYFYLDTDLYAPFVSLARTGENTRLVLKRPYLRRSYQSGRNVSAIIGETIPNTFILATAAIVFATITGLIMGLAAALRKGTWLDHAALFFSAIGMSLPSFFAAILIGWIFAYLLGDITGLNLTGNLYEIDDFGEGRHLMLKNLILPAFTLGIRPLAVITQLSRNSLLEVLSQDYIRTARAKGLHSARIIRKHALRNSLNPVVTAVSGWFASMLAGVIFVEYIFGWKGLGYIMVEALNQYDLPLVLGCVLTISIVFIVINLLVDMVYSWLDPRIRIGGD